MEVLLSYGLFIMYPCMPPYTTFFNISKSLPLNISTDWLSSTMDLSQPTAMTAIIKIKLATSFLTISDSLKVSKKSRTSRNWNVQWMNQIWMIDGFIKLTYLHMNGMYNEQDKENWNWYSRHWADGSDFRAFLKIK